MEERRPQHQSIDAILNAVKQGDVEKVKHFFNTRGAKGINDTLAECPYGETLLHYAAYHGHTDVVALLIRAGANVNSRGTKSGATPLHSAAAGGHLGIVALLVSCGADPNTKSFTNWTPLHCCSCRGYENLYWYLTQKCGCDPHAVNVTGATPEAMMRHQLEREKEKEDRDKALPLESEKEGEEDLWGKPHEVTVNPEGILNPDGTLSIQISSDVHVEFFNESEEVPDNLIIPTAPVLALLGDIGNPLLANYAEFLFKQAERFKLVLVLAGNHEYYSPYLQHPKQIPPTPQPTHKSMNAAIRAICASHPRLIFMDRTTLHIGPYCILGTTLWAAVPEERKPYVQQSMNDYNFIFAQEDGMRIDVNSTTQWHAEEVAWLAQEVRKSITAAKKSIILTHHTPSFEVDGSGYAFSTNLEYFFKDYGKKGNSNVMAWMYGHTHYSDDQYLHGTRVVSNQCGYRTEKNKKYSPKYVVTVGQ